jgi:hypothetical protein
MVDFSEGYGALVPPARWGFRITPFGVKNP